ncbi:hypothetical protein [Paenibacillus sp. PDC88]|uniref:hypothetical protein n=1 Tax=Paenibacillus sp. PDC88 TaxID=1884375 RepID=UPI0008968C00|nr:hypothetical protein [Paenibacillus sp. PDC88]SDW22827.1 hypothetical protein SAMN05518848_101721 [Paenibacillus sp. PDC88]
MKFMRPLTSDIHFYTAKMERAPIVVFIERELVGSGVIEDITETSVKISGERFMRGVCTFKYAV